MNTASPSGTVTARWDGMISHSEAVERLDQQRIRGAFRDDGSFIGYDYAKQKWVEFRPGGRGDDPR